MVQRCKWAENVVPVYQEYHDKQWGVPVHDDRELFEMLILESFHTGLSWLIILKKRDSFREAFDQFDPVKMSEYGEEKVNELLNNEKIVRNRLKIKAAIQNAKTVLDIQKEWGSFSEYLWHFTKNQVIRESWVTGTTSPLSDEIAKDMKKRGMRFMGSVTTYSYLQAVGLINAHEEDCFCSKKSEADVLK